MRLLIKPLFLLCTLLASVTSAAKPSADQADIFEARGLFALDYEIIPISGDKDIDLLGFHYVHQLSNWFYLGAGLHAPLFRGEYGGFMAFDVTAHARKQLSEKIYFNAGISLGGGGGGSDIEQSKLLSGEGGFIKHYAGLAYQFPQFSLGLGYSHFRFFNSLIDSSQLNIFVQKPISFLAGRYLKSNRSSLQALRDFCSEDCPQKPKIKVSADFAHLTQIDPEGIYKGDIDLLSLQYSYFLNRQSFIFIGGDAGVRGLPLYNQVLGGLGYQKSLSKRFNLVGQLGIGSGGYAPSEIETGAGLLAYPKFALEYSLSNKLNLSLSAGYLAALKGSSKNYSMGVGLSYYIAGKDEKQPEPSLHQPNTKKVRAHFYHQSKFDLYINDEKLGDLHMVSSQFDYVFDDRWYVPTQLSFAYGEYHSYPGYGEILLGLGVQTRPLSSRHWQAFFQTLVGSNIGGGMIKPELGLNYAFSDQLAGYVQAGISKSLGSLNRHTLSSYHLGFGLSYRFTMLQ